MMNRTQALLLKVMEECDELSQRCSKAIRFTLSEKQTGQDLTNAERIREELIDLFVAIEVLAEEKHLNLIEPTDEECNDRKNRIEKYIQYSQSLGTIQ